MSTLGHGHRKEIVSGGGGMTKEIFRAAKYSEIAKAVFQKVGGGTCPGPQLLQHCGGGGGRGKGFAVFQGIVFQWKFLNRVKLKCCFGGKQGVILRKVFGKLYFESAKNERNFLNWVCFQNKNSYTGRR